MAPKAPKARADLLLFEQGLAESQDAAMRLVMAGAAHYLKNGEKLPVASPGQQLPADTEFVLRGQDRFASRGGYKLLTAIETLGFDPSGKVCLDAGASTGGFTDCLLQHGAARVYAADVGYGQLHWKLRSDPRVVVVERMNLRTPPPVGPGSPFPELFDVLTADLSFISLTAILPGCMALMKPCCELAVLIKPQFELPAGRTDKGVVRSETDRREAVDAVLAFCRQELGLGVSGVVPSALLGPKGNQEYVALLRRG
ncbi:23S rRNA (cytidine1920-2'-O)/16S rRNA (cytidine1409-2'-O)-methyltransferase [Humidesulfovibrio mexicanus]|uniref:23S rRNA (Cytidine1920-2'-O)/16S rRNA (Cytidine1409-2'-O)-methyltransferase n=1 Tax=Humidesulfovibrio mexicanus TaxID=147047 RepID=A0A238Z6J8_9BACT|nr:TlyA family RNA methyltransferase [Humidesulfovibrio mexicanus]SNR78443.1 23S rRNA (cytidine1920-2'-O)/16S rRNA (cytidine1409-2'-O)-methyltransferase [Humidesulfovibrio mexicanus]